MAEKNETVVALTLDELKALLAGTRPTQAEELERMERQADLTAEANRKALRPENVQHPGISAFSRPGGELANPKGELRYRMTWAGTPVDKDALTPEEFDLMNELTPGDYRCTRPDGSKFPVQITGTSNPNTGQLDRIDVFFATRGQLRHGLPSMVVMCRELIAQAKVPVKVA